MPICPSEGPDQRCQDCKVSAACQHNCACVNLARSGDIAHADEFICFYERACLEAAARFSARLYDRQHPASPPPVAATVPGYMHSLAI